MELCRSRDKYLTNLRIIGEDPRSKAAWPSLIEKRGGGMIPCFSGPQGQYHMGSTTSHRWKAHERKDVYSDPQLLIQSGTIAARKKRIHAQVTLLFSHFKSGILFVEN